MLHSYVQGLDMDNWMIMSLWMMIIRILVDVFLVLVSFTPVFLVMVLLRLTSLAQAIRTTLCHCHQLIIARLHL